MISFLCLLPAEISPAGSGDQPSLSSCKWTVQVVALGVALCARERLRDFGLGAYSPKFLKPTFRMASESEGMGGQAGGRSGRARRTKEQSCGSPACRSRQRG